jgi:hypothetical protein
MAMETWAPHQYWHANCYIEVELIRHGAPPAEIAGVCPQWAAILLDRSSVSRY